MGRTVVLGRKTFESIRRPLPGRRMIVITRQAAFRPAVGNVEVARDIKEAYELAVKRGDDEVFIMGGAEIYPIALPDADKLMLTKVHANVEGDARFPKVDWNEWTLVSRSEKHERDEQNEFAFTFETFDRSCQTQ